MKRLAALAMDATLVIGAVLGSFLAGFSMAKHRPVTVVGAVVFVVLCAPTLLVMLRLRAADAVEDRIAEAHRRTSEVEQQTRTADPGAE